MSGATLTGRPARYERGVQELASGVWAWLQPNGAWGEANAGCLAGDGEALVIDTLWDERLAREMLDAFAARLDGTPIRHAVNTHSDGDHWWGNGMLPADATILASAPALELMREEPGPGELARQAKLAGAAAKLPGPTRGFTRYVSRMLGPFEFDGIEPRLPDRALGPDETLDVGGRRVRVITVGPAHTAGDAIVHVPDAGVVFAADVLFVGSTPVLWQGPVDGWLRALETVLALDADTYVPGHGPVAKRAQVEALRDYWTRLDAATREHHAAGRSASEAAAAILRAPDAPHDWECPERTVISVTALYRHLEGKPPVGTSPIARSKLFAAVAALQQA